MSLGLISSAYAQSAAPAAAGGGDQLLFFSQFIIIGLIVYFLMIRPQQQKAKQLKNQLAQLRRGDSVVTAGGIVGTVARVVNDDELLLDIAENVRVRVIRATITTILSKGEPANDTGRGGDETPAKPPRRRKAGAEAESSNTTAG